MVGKEWRAQAEGKQRQRDHDVLVDEKKAC